MNAQAVVERDEDALPAVPAANLTPMQMAYQLVAKGADFASVREMLDYAKALEREANETAFNAAMSDAQAEMEPVRTNARNPQTKSNYATYDKLDIAIRPLYVKHGFALSFDEADCPKPDHVRIVCFVSHRNGHCRTYHRDMPADGKGAKGGDVMTKTHAVGAAGSYAMRYLLRGIFNIAVGEEDKDGNAPRQQPTQELKFISDAQINELHDLIGKAGTTPEKFCEIAKTDNVADVLDEHFGAFKAMLLKRIEKRNAKPRVDPKDQFDAMERGNV